MKDLEFYIFEDELWCLFPDGSNQPVTDKDIGLMKSVLDRIRECYPDAYKALMECYQKAHRISHISNTLWLDVSANAILENWITQAGILIKTVDSILNV